MRERRKLNRGKGKKGWFRGGEFTRNVKGKVIIVCDTRTCEEAEIFFAEPMRCDIFIEKKSQKKVCLFGLVVRRVEYGICHSVRHVSATVHYHSRYFGDRIV